MSSTRSISAAASAAVSSVRRGLALTVVVALGAFAAPVIAQSGGGSQQAFAIRPFVGGYVPTGAQRDFLKGSVFAGGQASWQVIPELALVGTFGWSPSNDKITSGQPKLDLYQYDLGAELSQPGMWGFSPFVGLGVGGRTYNYRSLDVSTKTDFDGYGAIGGDIPFRTFALRLEARDYVSQFKPLNSSGGTQTRNDVALAAGLSIRF